MVCVRGGWGWQGLVGVSAWCVCGLFLGGGRGGMVWGRYCRWWRGAGVGDVLGGSLGVPLGLGGVVCACCAVSVVRPHQVQLTQARQLFITAQGTASIEGTAFGRRRPSASGETDTTYLDKRNAGHRHYR